MKEPEIMTNVKTTFFHELTNQMIWNSKIKLVLDEIHTKQATFTFKN
jgi:hypothetical protein